MANTLTLTINLHGTVWEIDGTLTSGTLPTDIFMYNNTGGITLGSFVGVCSVDELTRLQTHTGVAIPVFGNKFVKSPTLHIAVPHGTDHTTVVSTVVSSVRLLSKQYQANLNITQVYQIL